MKYHWLNLAFSASVCLILTLSALWGSFVAGQSADEYVAVNAFPKLSFNQPDGIIQDPTNSSRLFLIEQAGQIKVFNNTQETESTVTFLDITSRVLYGGEQGLLGLAFHPNYTDNHYFYINYVVDNPRRTIIARYTTAQNNPNQADPNSQRTILEIAQPYSNHKGGQLAFGPDGYLYIGVGDGGSEGDPNGNGQNRQTLLGKILRIDVNNVSQDRNYSIPQDNPYFGNAFGYREEIYAYGFRNPWRFGFDAATGKLWVGDVGQDKIEEIDVVESGKNYGWNTMEGTLCYNPPNGCNQTGLTLPVYNYTHSLGNAIIGGYVYHGKINADLEGAYIYGDYGSGRIWALRLNGTTTDNTQLVKSGLNLASFGVDQNQELYFTAYDGKIYKLTKTAIPEYSGIWTIISILVAATIISLVAVKKRSQPNGYPIFRA